MIKEVFFTVDGRESDERNGIKKYQNFTYDTTTKELKFVDIFEDETKEISLGTAVLTKDNTSALLAEIERTKEYYAALASAAMSGNTSGNTSGTTSGTTDDDPSGLIIDPPSTTIEP